MHLTHGSYRQLLNRTLPPPAARVLQDHLRSDCDACEGFLTSRDRADALDGVVDEALAQVGRVPAAAAGNDLEFARIMATVRRGPVAVRARPAPLPAPTVLRPSREGAPRRRLAVPLAAAAALLLAGLAGLLATRSPTAAPPAGWDGLKGGAAQAVPLRLRFLVLVPAPGAAPVLEKGVSGQEVPAEASLQFQVELGRPAEVVLVRSGPGGTEVFFRGRLPGGRSALTVAGQPAAYPLAALAGPQRFLALASERPIDPADVGRAAALEAAGRGGPSGEEQAISLDRVEVTVRPSMGR